MKCKYIKEITMKDKLFGIFGGFGAIVYLIVGFLMMFAPLYIIGFPLWSKALFIAVYYFAPAIMGYVAAPLYIWAIVIAARQPIDVVSIIFFVLAALYFFVILFPSIMALISKR